MSDGGFERVFGRAAGLVRRALAARVVLDGLCAGALGGAAIAIGCWALAKNGGTVATLACASAGILAGAVVAWQRRWSNQDVALYLDARLTQNEAISTALEVRDDDTDVAREITWEAARALEGPSDGRVRPRVLRGAHVALPLVALTLALLHWVPAPRRNTDAALVGAAPKDVVRRSLDGLRRVEALRETQALGPEERKRLDALVASARDLELRARSGVERKDALDALARLGDGVTAERALLASSKNRAGLEAAMRALEGHDETRDAARALGNADPALFDREMAKIAHLAEKQSRDAAASALGDAANAARGRGAEEVAQALDEQRHLLQHRAAQSATLKELERLLGQSLPPEERRGLERLERASSGSDEALASALTDALEGLSPEERRRLVESLTHATEGMQADGSLSRGEIERLAKALSSKEARDELRDELRKLANGEPSASARKAETLAMAQLGIGDAQRSLTSDPSDSGALGSKADPSAPSIGNQSSGAASPSGSLGEHTPGSDAPSLATSFAARAQARNLGSGIYAGKAPGNSPPGALTASAAGAQNPVSAAGPREIGAVERSNVPREYRDQVRRYFTP